MKHRGIYSTMIILIIIGSLITGCLDTGTTLHSRDGVPYPKYVSPQGDTITFGWMAITPNNGIWVGTSNQGKCTSLTYPVGKTQETVVILDRKEQVGQVINGYIISENDSVVVIKKY